MDEHLTRALYLGAALLFFAIAFTSFFGLYRSYEDYYSHAADSGSEDRLVRGEAASGETAISGDAVAGLILEKRRYDSEALLQELYSDSVTVSDPLPDTYVDGVNYADYDLMSIRAEYNYDAHYTFDSSGNPVRIDFHRR